jgi:hypothetical protein
MGFNKISSKSFCGKNGITTKPPNEVDIKQLVKWY